MRLYSGPVDRFISDTVRNRVADKLKDAFFAYHRFQPGPSEVTSWRNSLRATAQVFQEAGFDDHGVILEYQLPMTSKRLDCMVSGRDAAGAPNAVIMELKQWDKCEEAYGDEVVATFVGGAVREVLHPSAQVGRYQRYLEDSHTAFYDGENPIKLSSCAYLHNYTPVENDLLLAEKYRPLLDEFPTYTADDVDELLGHLTDKLGAGGGMPLLEQIEESRYRPSKKLLDHVAGVIKGKPEYVLLDEQEIVYERVLSAAQDGFADRKHAVVIVKGGPGTGKSVIAINLLADLSLKGFNSHYATGSKAFTETLRKAVGKRSEVQFKYFNQYGQAQPNDVDVLICDEAHRIRVTSNDRFTPKANRSDNPQIDELFDAAKVNVFFIDDKQGVRPLEIGSADYIRDAAARRGSRVFDYQLEAQFRCAGSDGFVNWVSNTLEIERTANVLWDAGDEQFDFRIMDSPAALETAIRQRVFDGNTGRMVAGFCWPWSKPKADRTLEDDVVIGDFGRPWNARSDAGRLAQGIPKESFWATDPNGIEQVGCVYTAQGFEFDYVGVIWGPDLVYDFDANAWRGDKTASKDSTVKRAKEGFTEFVKNTYRVLLSRGMKGCYVYFMDKDTERYFKSRMEGLDKAADRWGDLEAAESKPKYGSE